MFFSAMVFQQGFSTNFFPGVFCTSGRNSQVSHLSDEEAMLQIFFSLEKTVGVETHKPLPRLELCCFNQLLAEIIGEKKKK